MTTTRPSFLPIHGTTRRALRRCVSGPRYFLIYIFFLFPYTNYYLRLVWMGNNDNEATTSTNTRNDRWGLKTHRLELQVYFFLLTSFYNLSYILLNRLHMCITTTQPITQRHEKDQTGPSMCRLGPM